MTNRFDSEMWICDIQSSIQCKGGGGQTTTQTTQKTEPWAAQQPFLKTGFERAETDVLNRPLEFFGSPGDTVVPFSPETETALGGTTNRALGGNPLMNAAQDNLTQTAGGGFLSQGNPAFQAVADRVGGDVRQRVDSQFAGAGRYGSPGHQEATARGIGDALAPYAFSNYENERGRQQQAAQLAPGFAANDYQDLGALAGVGAKREDLSGENLAEDIARFNFEQGEPTNRLAQFMNLVQGQYGGESTGTTTGSAQRSSNSLASGLGLGIQAFSAAQPGGTVICTEAHRQGYYDDALMAGDRIFGKRIATYHPEVMAGYHYWALPVVSAMRRSPLVARIVAFVARPAVEEMATRVGHGPLMGSLVGKTMLAIGIPLCRMIGRWLERRRIYDFV